MNDEVANQKESASQDSGLVRSRIIETATQLFARKGYAGTSVREIAEAANTTVPMLYYYFNSKEGLYLYLLEDGVRAFLDGIPDGSTTVPDRGTPIPNKDIQEPEASAPDTSVTEPPARDLLAYALAAIISFCQANRVTIELIFESWVMGSCPAGAPRVEHVYSVMVKRFVAILEKGIRRGEFRQLDVWMVAQHIVGIVTNIMARHLVGDEGFDPQKTAQDIVDLIVRGIEHR